jgi:hypothetical protein
MNDATTTRAARDALREAHVYIRDIESINGSLKEPWWTHRHAILAKLDAALARLCEPEPEAEKVCGEFVCGGWVKDNGERTPHRNACCDYHRESVLQRECICANCGRPYSAHVASRAHPALPVPGVDGCPEWARWIAWSELTEFVGRAFVYPEKPTFKTTGLHGGGSRYERLPAFDSPSRAGQCVKLPEPAPTKLCSMYQLATASWCALESDHDGACRYTRPKLTTPEPAKKAEPVMLWRAWQNAGSQQACCESTVPMRTDAGYIEFEKTPGVWTPVPPEGSRWVGRDGEKPGAVEYIGPGPDPREPVMPRCEFVCPNGFEDEMDGCRFPPACICAREGCGKPATDPCHAREGEKEWKEPANADTSTTSTATPEVAAPPPSNTSSAPFPAAASCSSSPTTPTTEAQKPVRWEVLADNPHVGALKFTQAEAEKEARAMKHHPGIRIRPLYAAPEQPAPAPMPEKAKPWRWTDVYVDGSHDSGWIPAEAYDALWLACEEARTHAEYWKVEKEKEVERGHGHAKAAYESYRAATDRIKAERDAEKARADGLAADLRSIAQTAIAAAGSVGPENADSAVARLVAKLEAAESRLAAMESDRTGGAK